MPLYDKPIQNHKKNSWVKPGVEVNICGEGSDIFEIFSVVKDKSGDIVKVLFVDYPWREPLSKISLASSNKTKYIDVAIGECDICGEKFGDSCCYSSKEGDPKSMICSKCQKSNKIII